MRKDIIVGGGGRRQEPQPERNCEVEIHGTSWLDPDVDHAPGLNPGYGWIGRCSHPSKRCLIEQICNDPDYKTQVHDYKGICPLGNRLRTQEEC